MDLKKVLDQTIREVKREVNKKVLKVPEIEQKVLDATSNEPWGPHGTLMADIAQATRNYTEYQMIMAVLWKRINDTGRNWRHVYKALTILEFLVAHGSERVIDELREHSYQISTLADFQYVESSGKDQGVNVRKKSQALVALVNDKEKIREVRQKAVANRDKYRGLSSTGGIYKPSSYSSTSGSYGGDRYNDDRYGSSTSKYGGRDDDRYGRDRDGDRYRDEDRFGRDWDRSGRDGDRYGREGDRYRDEYNKDYDHEDDRYSSRRGDERQTEKYGSFDKDRDRSFDDDDRYSSRSGGGKGDDYGQDDRRVDRKLSGGRMPAPPSYEEALGSSDYGYRAEEQRDGGGLAAAVARASKSNAGQTVNSENANSVNKATAASNESNNFDDFDPRASTAPVPPSAVTSQSDDFFVQSEPVGSMKALPPPPALSTNTSNASDFFGHSSFTSSFVPAPPSNTPVQLNGDVFGDSPFKVEAPTSTVPNAAAAAAINPQSSFVSASMAEDFAAAGAMNSMSSNGFNAFGSVTTNPPVPMSFVGNEFFVGDSFTAFSAPNGMTAVPSSASTPSQHSAPGASQVNQNQASAVPLPQQQPIPVASRGQKDSLAPSVKNQQNTKFETKSTVWADTLSKGLIDLNIAGPKTNPLADLGIDFDLLRTERIKEERASTKPSSAINMGKAMGSGSGLGLAGASAILPPPVPVMMGGSMAMGPNMGVNPMGMGIMGMGSGMGTPPVMPMGVNPGMAMRPTMGMGSTPGMGMGLNQMTGMGIGGYPNQQQQYGGFR